MPGTLFSMRYRDNAPDAEVASELYRQIMLLIEKGRVKPSVAHMAAEMAEQELFDILAASAPSWAETEP